MSHECLYIMLLKLHVIYQIVMHVSKGISGLINLYFPLPIGMYIYIYAVYKLAVSCHVVAIHNTV